MSADEELQKDQRIADLEGEVAALRARLEPEEDDPPPTDRLVPASNRARLIAVSALVLLVTLGVMFAIFQAISSGIQSVAPRAATYFTDDEPKAKTPPPAPKPGGQGRQDAPRAPGL